MSGEVLAARADFEAALDAVAMRRWPSHANFILVYIGAQHAEFVRLMSAGGVLVRDRSNDPGCDGCVRITIGTREQMREAVVVLDNSDLSAWRSEGEAMMAKAAEKASKSKAIRKSAVARDTHETRIAIALTIEGKGIYKVSTGIRFFDHMLELFTRHGAFDLELDMQG